MAIAVQQIRPIAHWPLILSVLRRLEVATVVDGLLPPHPEHVVSTGRGVEALVLAILDGAHALYKVGPRLHADATFPDTIKQLTYVNDLDAYTTSGRTTRVQCMGERRAAARP